MHVCVFVCVHACMHACVFVCLPQCVTHGARACRRHLFGPGGFVGLVWSVVIELLLIRPPLWMLLLLLLQLCCLRVFLLLLQRHQVGPLLLELSLQPLRLPLLLDLLALVLLQEKEESEVSMNERD